MKEEIYFLRKLGVCIEEDMHTCTNNIYYKKKKFHLYENIDHILSGINKNQEFFLKRRGIYLWLCMVIRKDLFLNRMKQNIVNRSSRIRFLSQIFNNVEIEALNYQSFENYDDNNDDDSHKFDVNKFYELVREVHKNEIYSNELSDNYIDFNSLLSVELRPYQKKAVRWLIHRETQSTKILQYNLIQLEYEANASEENANKNILYLNKKTLNITDEWPFYNVLPKGGILADEMGLGKTIEILSLILLNRNLKISNEIIDKTFEPPSKMFKYDHTQLYCICSKSKIKEELIQCPVCLTSQHKKCVTKFVKNENNYKCPECWSSCDDLIKSSATVVISPHTIALQWLQEIEKHSKIKLNTFYYTGYAKCGWINPKDLSEFDIIVTDYNVLKKEVYYCNASRNLRSPKKYMRIKSPLLLVKWLRVCLDEAQMVENVMSLTAKMAKSLPTKYRWAITGTPIQKSIDDLKGLVDFIGAYPFFENRVWNDLVNFQNLRIDGMPFVRVLGNLMWRTCKVNVLDEIGIPSQSEIIYYINMSDEEKLYYRSEHELYSTVFEERIKNYVVSSTSLLDLDSKNVFWILQPLMKLSQICTAAVTIQQNHQDIISKKCLPSQELLKCLKKKNENICKVELRRICCCYNGMAAIDIIEERFNEAIMKYQSVLDLVKTYNGPSIYVDTLLQIHSLYNLITLKNMMPPEDENENLTNYENECVRLEWKYLEPHYNRLKKVQKNCDIIRKKVQNIEETKLTENIWWGTILNYINDRRLNEQLINKINLDNRTFKISFDDEYETVNGIKTIHDIDYVLTTWTDEIFSYRKKILKEFDSFNHFVNNIKPRNELTKNIQKIMKNFMKSVYDCHLAERSDDTENLCNLCETKNNLLIYERTFTCENDDSTMQAILLKLLSFAKSHSISLDYVKHGEQFLEFIEAIKKEHKEYEKFWVEIEYIVKAYDELDMCRMRLQSQNGKESNEYCYVRPEYQLRSHEIVGVYLQNEYELKLAKHEFSNKLGRLKYISHLQDENDPGACPVCKLDIVTKYSLFECGHHLCMTCLNRMTANPIEIQMPSLTCAICRYEQRYKDIYIVSKKEEDSEIVGQFSSKIDKIIRVIINLKNTDENIKILVFSQYEDNLKLISKGLQYNDIKCLMDASAEHVDDFKNKQKGITCLLVRFNESFKGLDLTEATQLVLVEPIINPDEELQAINRIHRSGQTKPTVVHRFIVKNSIEEAIQNKLVKYINNVRQKNHIYINNIRKLFTDFE